MPLRRSSGAHLPWDARPPGAAERAAWSDARPVPFWLDSPERPAARPALEGRSACALAIVGAGLSGLWAALEAKERAPERDVVLLDAGRIANAASGRNGGFLDYSLTHGIANGRARFPHEIEALERLGLENFAAVVATVERLGVECDLEPVGSLAVAAAPHEVEWLAEYVAELDRHGHDAELYSRDRVREELHSPILEAGVWHRNGAGIVDPARLSWGLARAFEASGGRIHEKTAVTRLTAARGGVELELGAGTLHAEGVVLATSASAGLVGAIRRRVVPVWDYVLVSEPLTAAQRDAIGWRNRQGVSDSSNRFHYYRLTADDRILWGGYDAIYGFGNANHAGLEQRPESFDRLAAHFFTAFPQLEGTRFTHRWGGAIDTCSRFFAFHGLAMGGRVAYTVGHTGLGVGASRFGATVALDLLDGRDSEATRLEAIRSKPVPFPPEPLRYAAIELTRNRLAAADASGGRRGIWLRALDRLGLGFDS